MITADWLHSPDVQRLFDLFDQAGFEIYAVGGCVRNTLLNRPIVDVDLSTNARPAQVMELLETVGLRAVPTGFDHGTITAVVDGTPYEITTYRKDVETDGRRAVVHFADTIGDDSLRRDFTINAIYADAAGQLYDPQQGLQDISPTQIRFIGDPDARIAEDYLRILRFFRFFAQYGDPDAGLDADGLAACASGADGLAHISRERIGAEVLKTLAVDNPSMAMAAMAQAGVLHRILPGADPAALPVLVHLEHGPPCPLRRLAVLGGEQVADHLRLSKQQGRDLASICTAATMGTSPHELAYRHGTKIAWDAVLVRCALLGIPVPDTTAHDIDYAAQAVFPLKAKDLPQFSGAALGRALKSAERFWIDHQFKPTQIDLMHYLNALSS
ncbi:MAG: CCA tRNA nucleotidyltransferase [Pseudomonadota bacterium]